MNATCTPDCPPGQECVNGLCVCDATSCPTGCCSNDNCIVTLDQSNTRCGTAGAACSACGAFTPTCEAGVCTGACGQPGNGTCPADACCQNGKCADGNAANVCGTGGGGCIDCTTSAIGHACVGAGTCGCNGDSDCPSGIHCDMNSHSCSCGSANCQGCCDPATGVCITPTAGACGSAGSMCQACPAGQACVDGKCACDSASCDGCCSATGCVPKSTETSTACGSGGAACMACPSGQACVGGACTCNAASCPNGCCNGDTCVPFTAQTGTSCGKGGVACGPCATGQACTAGSCGCDSGACSSGCCDGSGACQPGNLPAACGGSGNACATCAPGQECQGGKCSCNAASCPNGCCDANGVCQAPAPGSCGGNGNACVACAAGQECQGGACVCDATSCPNGCCNGSSCVPFASQTNSSCGTAGAACGGCKDLTPTCSAGVCTGSCGGTGNGTCAGGCCSGSGCAPGTANNACGTSAGACVDCSSSVVGHVCRSGACGCNSNSDCGGGKLCNLASHTCGDCNNSTCPNGCCDANGLCQSPSPTSCGSGGNSCTACGAGQACSGGSCVCNTSSCANGCCDGSSCVPTGSQGPQSCGAGGAVCGSCASDPAGTSCVGGHCGCNSSGDCAVGSICNNSSKLCVPGGSCAAGSCNGCCSGGICTGGATAGACGVGGTACADCTASTPMCQGDATCTGGTCQYSPSGPGTGCSPLFCTVGQTCNGAGACTGGTPRDCTGGNACLVCTCSNSTSACSCNTKSINAASSLTVTSSCLTAGTGARLAVVLKLVDNAGAPTSGATVTFSGTGSVSWLEPNSVEVPGSPGTYYRTLLAPAAAGSTTISASVSYCSASTPITTTQAVSFSAPAPTNGYANSAFQGVGGCSPVGGHLRVKVIAAETGLPIAGASVLVGAAAGTPFVSSADGLFPAPNPTGSNVATTNAQGIAELVDFGSALQGAQLVTAGAANRAYQTYYKFNGADQVLALPLRRPARNAFRFTNNTGMPIPSRPDCTWVQAGFQLQDTTLDQLGVFNLSSLVGPNKCIDTGAIGMKSIPENIFAPPQSLSTIAFLCIANINSPSNMTVDGGMRELAMPFVRIPVSVLTGNGGLTSLIQGAVFQTMGYAARTVNGDVNGTMITLNDSYPVKATFNFSNTPAGTDVTGVVLNDYSGGNGTGALGINGIQIHKATDAGTSVVVPVGTVNGAPAGTRYLGAAVASFLPPLDGRNIPDDVTQALTSQVVRDGANGMPPFGSGANSSLSVNGFLKLAPALVTNSGKTFTFGDATNGVQTPQYSISTLAVQHTTWQPQLPCETEPSKVVTTYPQWVVVRPHINDGTACGALQPTTATCETFTLPTLPASFPQAGSGTQQQQGLEQYIGSGSACAASACVLASEKCQVPTATTLPAQCMGQEGASFFTERYLWTLEDRALGNAPNAVRAGSADLTQWRPGLTQESANKVNW